jgi:hypothetical protein
VLSFVQVDPADPGLGLKLGLRVGSAAGLTGREG